MRRTGLVLLLLALILQTVPMRLLGQIQPSYEAQPIGRTSYLGIGLVDVDDARARALHMESPRGAEVTRVDEGSPADKSGIKPGDVLLAYNGENILGGQQLARLVTETPPGRRVTIQYWRTGKNLTATVLTAVRPRNTDSPSDGWASGMQDSHGFIVNPAEIPFPLFVWRNMILGIECESLQPGLGDYFGASRGVLVRAVQRGSVADNAGLHAGDVIVALAEHAVASPRELTAIIRAVWAPGRAMRVQFLREHKRLTADLTVPPDAQ